MFSHIIQFFRRLFGVRKNTVPDRTACTRDGIPLSHLESGDILQWEDSENGRIRGRVIQYDGQMLVMIDLQTMVPLSSVGEKSIVVEASDF